MRPSINVISDELIAQVLDEAKRILAEVGVEVRGPKLRERLLDLPLPERAATLDELMTTALRDVMPYPMGNGHPAFFGWVNPPPSRAGVLASLAAAAMNPSVVAGDHADVHLERAVVPWLAELVGFPHRPGAAAGVSGGSAATIASASARRVRGAARAATIPRQRSGDVGWSDTLPA